MDDSQALHPQFGAILSAGEVSKGHAKREKRNVKRDKLEHEKGDSRRTRAYINLKHKTTRNRQGKSKSGI